MKNTLLGLVIVLLCAGCALEGDHFLPAYTIVYHPNGGTGSMKESAHVFGTEKKLNANKFTRLGFAFTGWSLTANGSVVYRDKASVKNLTKTDGETIPLFAQWKLKIDMVWIQPTKDTTENNYFKMGSPTTETGRDATRESPQHQVTLNSGFYMGQYEVTQAQYEAVMGTNPSAFSSNPAPGEVQENRPVEQVSWYDAVEFCNKLSEIEGLSKYYTINGTDVTRNASTNGYRLPVEAQWEYACRAETTTAWYFGDNDIDDYAWYTSNSGDRTHEVGKKLPNKWGLYDMHGNVWEWCWNWYEDYPKTTLTGPSSGTLRIIRGGAWLNDGQYLRSAYRGRYDPSGGNYGNASNDSIGFRVVRAGE